MKFSSTVILSTLFLCSQNIISISPVSPNLRPQFPTSQSNGSDTTISTSQKQKLSKKSRGSKSVNFTSTIINDNQVILGSITPLKFAVVGFILLTGAIMWDEQQLENPYKG